MTRSLLLLFVLPISSAIADGGLGGSRMSMRRQHAIAREHNYRFLRTAAEVRAFARADRLERLTGNANYSMARMSFPYARPAVKLFVERLAEQFRAATGERLVVTSLTRPISMQPRNASPLSVHPAGMAVDFRVPSHSWSRRWLENTLLSLEEKNVLDVTRERRPPHYHVAVFPEEYMSYVAMVTSNKIEVIVVDAGDVLPAPGIAATTPIAAQQAEVVVAEFSMLSRTAVAALAGAGVLALLALFGLRRDRARAVELESS